MAVKIFVDQGHNPYGVNAGAEAFGVREQDITYLVGAYLVDILNADPRFDAIASRQTPDEILGYDNNSSLRERVDMANTALFRQTVHFFCCFYVNVRKSLASLHFRSFRNCFKIFKHSVSAEARFK